MSGALEITHSDDSPLLGITLTAERGVPSAHVEVKITNIGDVTVPDAFVTMYTEQPPGTGKFFSSGSATLDERQGRFEITGQNSDSSPGQEVVLGNVQPMGHLAVALLPPILPGDWIIADVWIEQPGASASGGSVNVKLEVAHDRKAYANPMGLGYSGSGINRGKKQAKSYLIIGRHVSPSGPADDQIHFEPGQWLINGVEYRDDTVQDVTLNQNDDAVEALASGESYVAVVTQGPGEGAAPTVTKGLRDTAPTRPVPPPGELILAWATVSYQSGGTSVIAGGDLTEDLTYGRMRVGAPPTGLTVIVEAGESIIGDYVQVRPIKGFVDLAASSTNYIWMEWNGNLSVNTIADPPPSYGALLLAVAITDATSVISLLDTRRYYHAGELLTETPIGDIDGVNTTYTLQEDEEGMLMVDGFMLLPDVQYQRVGKQILNIGPLSPPSWLRWIRVG